MGKIKFKLTFFVNKLIVIIESKNQWFLYGWRYDGTLFFCLLIFHSSDLRKAHQANDRAVMEAYGFAKDITESEIVAELFKMYEKLTEGK